MLCCDTNELPAIVADPKRLVRVEMTVNEAREMVSVVEEVRHVRTYGHGDGELRIPLIGGVFSKILTQTTRHVEKALALRFRRENQPKPGGRNPKPLRQSFSPEQVS